jgi:hypothetical protein
MSRIAFALVSLLCTHAFAQGGGGGAAPMSYDAIMKAPVGSWAEYVTTMKGRTEAVKFKYSVVEKNPKRVVIEVDGTTPMGAMLMRMEYEPAGEGALKVTKARMQMGDAAPMDMPIPPGTPLLKKDADTSDLVGKETVKTAIGTFDCKKYKKTVSQGPVNMTFHVWISDKALPIGLVKQANVEETLVVTLTATGTGATAKMKASAEPAKKPEEPAPGKKAPAAAKPEQSAH